jgi:general secretion pathway protein M
VSLSPGFSRALALLLLLLLLVVLWRATAAPLWGAWQADRDAVVRQRDAIARLRGLASMGADYRRALERSRASNGFDGALIEAPSATLAAAELQQQVKALVEGAGGSLVSAQPVDTVPAGPFTRIGLSLRVLVSVQALQKVLYELETRRPLVVIDEMLVLSRAGSARNRRRAKVTGQLDVRLQVGSFLAPGGGA